MNANNSSPTPLASQDFIMPGVSAEMLQKYDVSGPRYTSYPTADRFVEAFTEGAYKLALEQRRVGGLALPLSIYVHTFHFASRYVSFAPAIKLSPNIMNAALNTCAT